MLGGVTLIGTLGLVSLVSSFSRHEHLWDNGWKFHRGLCPVAEDPHQAAASLYAAAAAESQGHVRMPECTCDQNRNYGVGFIWQGATATYQLCCSACTANAKCLAWDWHSGTCFLKDNSASNVTEQGRWSGRAAQPPAPPPAPPSDACASTSYNDAGWRSLSLPHDWTREDLPSRKTDTEFPVIDARYGVWKLHAGDSASFAAPGYNDSAWPGAKGGVDWRTYGHAFEAVNATGWYRQQLGAVPPFMLNTTRVLTLSLGIIAGADATYLNGKLLGANPAGACGRDGCATGGDTLNTRLYITPRAYTIPHGVLNPAGGAPNVLAVRVRSYGGTGRGPANATNMSDGLSYPPYGTTFPGGFFDDANLKGGAATQRTGPFDAAVSPGAMGTGYTLGGTGYYRKTFSLADLPGGVGPTQRVLLRFDGVYMNSSMWLNGAWLGTHPYGFTTFEYDLTPHINWHGSNTITVRISNLGKNSRFYSGSGIYRHTWLTAIDQVHIPLWGASITTPMVAYTSADRATEAVVVATVTVANMGTTPADAVLTVGILRADGSLAGTAQGKATIPASANTTVNISVALKGGVDLWCPASPVMHRANITVQSTAGRVGTAMRSSAVAAGAPKTTTSGGSGGIDGVVVPFGVRTISFNSTDGFVLNGVETKLYGGCVHHDNGPLGAMAIDRAEERRVELLKSHGYTAIRTSHNPVSPAFLDACDKHGILVMTEAFDCWASGKNPEDYHVFFNEWWVRDLSAMVRRDRNHPSVVMWSIGNEIPMRFTRRGAALSANMTAMVHALNPGSGRAVTTAYPLIHEQDSPFLHNVDVAGYNYAGTGIFAEDHHRLPNRTFVSTESFAQSSFTMWSQIWSMPYVVGDFIWTAIDYLGDDYVGSEDGDVDYMAGRHPFPWHISFCGDFDIVGMAKPQSVYRRVLWGVQAMGILVHGPTAHPETPAPWVPDAFNWNWPLEIDSWTWPHAVGELVGVRVFARGCESARLTLDGTALATAPFHANLTAMFTVPYAPGKLEVLCINGTAVIPGIAAQLVSAGAPSTLTLTADRAAIHHDANDLCYVTVAVVDAHGVRVHDSTPITFTVSGPGVLVAVGSGDPSDAGSFTANTRTTWHGRALAILQPSGLAPGTITLTATSASLKPATIEITTSQAPPLSSMPAHR